MTALSHELRIVAHLMERDGHLPHRQAQYVAHLLDLAEVARQREDMAVPPHLRQPAPRGAGVVLLSDYRGRRA